VAESSSGSQAGQKASLRLLGPPRNALHQAIELRPTERPLYLIAPQANDIRVADRKTPTAAGRIAVIDAEVAHGDRLLAMFTVRADAEKERGSRLGQVEIQRRSRLFRPASLLPKKAGGGGGGRNNLFGRKRLAEVRTRS